MVVYIELRVRLYIAINKSFIVMWSQLFYDYILLDSLNLINRPLYVLDTPVNKYGTQIFDTANMYYKMHCLGNYVFFNYLRLSQYFR